ncbi:hypothetical protein B9X84_12080 [Acinetobacter baumannii]|nr:hypothetical protein B9X84_12080 [Acinetobacter baumannii]
MYNPFRTLDWPCIWANDDLPQQCGHMVLIKISLEENLVRLRFKQLIIPVYGEGKHYANT